DSQAGAVAEGKAFEQVFAAAEDLIRSVENSPAPEGRRCDPARIEAWLRAQPRGGERLRVESAQLPADGRSKQAILVNIHDAHDLPDQLVLRQDWAAAVTGTSVAMEFAVLERLHRAGVRVPEPLLAEPGSKPLDAPFIVVGRLPGS